MITTTIISPKQNQTIKQTNTCSFPQQRKLLFQRIFQVTCLGRKGGWGTGDGYTRTQKTFEDVISAPGNHGMWIMGSGSPPAKSRISTGWLAGCLSAFLFFARALAFCGVCFPFFFLLALSESASPLRHKKDCFPFSTASKNSVTCI